MLTHAFRYEVNLNFLRIRMNNSTISCNIRTDYNLSVRMKCVFYLLFSFCITAACAQKPARLIVRGDDMGFSHSGNEAIIQCYKNGIETSIEVIVPSPWFPEAVRLLSENPGIDVGVHLALTSEWDNLKWRPLSQCPSLVDADGYFFPFIWENKNYPNRALLQQPWQLEDVEKEFRAQIEMALKYIPRISHISAHMGCAEMTPAVKALVKKLTTEYNINIDPKDYGVVAVSYDGSHGSSKEKIASFIKMLGTLEPGHTYIFVDHPGFNTAELQAVSHIGYSDVAADRQGVSDAWTSEEVKAIIKRKNIQLISYKDLKKQN